MAEYIEREAAVKAAQDGADEWDGGFNRNRDAYIECAIDNVPAADVRENVKGEWEEHEVFPAKGNVDMLQSAFCPNCKRYHTTPYSYYFTEYAFCPNCGAKMEAHDG